MQQDIAEFQHSELIETFRQFGPFGIPCRILKEGHDTMKGWTVEIDVPQTGGARNIRWRIIPC